MTNYKNSPIRIKKIEEIKQKLKDIEDETGSVKLGNLDTYNTGISIPLCKEHYKEAFGIEALMREISEK